LAEIDINNNRMLRSVLFMLSLLKILIIGIKSMVQRKNEKEVFVENEKTEEGSQKCRITIV